MFVHVGQDDRIPFALKYPGCHIDMSIFDSRVSEKVSSEPQVLFANVNCQNLRLLSNSRNEVRPLPRSRTYDENSLGIGWQSPGKKQQLLMDAVIPLNNILYESSGKIVVEG
jgi:hypothetical protein